MYGFGGELFKAVPREWWWHTEGRVVVGNIQNSLAGSPVNSSMGSASAAPSLHVGRFWGASCGKIRAFPPPAEQHRDSCAKVQAGSSVSGRTVGHCRSLRSVCSHLQRVCCQLRFLFTRQFGFERALKQPRCPRMQPGGSALRSSRGRKAGASFLAHVIVVVLITHTFPIEFDSKVQTVTPHSLGDLDYFCWNRCHFDGQTRKIQRELSVISGDVMKTNVNVLHC